MEAMLKGTAFRLSGLFRVNCDVKITSLFSGILRSDWSQFKDEFRVKDAACLHSGRATVSPLYYLQLDRSYSDVPTASPWPTDLP
jgi:hypothetical protein